MLSLYSKIINSPIVDLQNQTRIGVAHELIINKTKMEIGGVVLKKTSLLKFGETEVIAASDILEIGSRGIIVNNHDAIVPLSEAVRLKEAIDKNFFGVYQRVVSKKGKNIGLVHDYLIDSSSFAITKFYCKTLFSERIISARSVIKIEGKKIFVKDDFDDTGISIPAVESSLV